MGDRPRQERHLPRGGGRRDRSIAHQFKCAQLVGTNRDSEFAFDIPPGRPRDGTAARVLRWLGRVTGLGPRPTPPPGTVTWRLRRKRLLRPLNSRLAKLLIKLRLRKPRQKVYRPNLLRDIKPRDGTGPYM